MAEQISDRAMRCPETGQERDRASRSSSDDPLAVEIVECGQACVCRSFISSDTLRRLSWTVMTWIVVFGSSVVMLLWIVIYSFFLSDDFVDEVIILFGNIQFWATVLMSILIALGGCHFRRS